jgi:hypothetical protein
VQGVLGVLHSINRSQIDIVSVNEMERDQLGAFIGRSVTAGTLKRYASGWTEWRNYVSTLRDSRVSNDPYLAALDDEGKSYHLARFFQLRHVSGLRGKAATAVGAAVRKHFEIGLKSTVFMDAPIVSRARKSCQMTTAESREYAKSDASKAKLPVCEEMVQELRSQLWENVPWITLEQRDMHMTYICIVYGFDIAVRVGEATVTSGYNENHTILAEELVFNLSEPVLVDGKEIYSVRGGSKELISHVVKDNILHCDVGALSGKTGALKKDKRIGRRSPAEEQFLEDLFTWIQKSGVQSKEHLFSRWGRTKAGKMSHKNCTPKMATAAIKKAAITRNLDPDDYAFHSLRKAAMTHMRAMGVSREESRDRGNYSSDSVVMEQVYDYDVSGFGPLASNSLPGGKRPGYEEMARYKKPKYTA